MYRVFCLCQVSLILCGLPAPAQSEDATSRTYDNQLIPIASPVPLLADYPEFFEPVLERQHFEAQPVVSDPQADLQVRAWRYSYNARGIVEMPNLLKAADTAVIMVHPWGIDDGQGWITPQPAGVADFCTVEKNHLAARHTREVVAPFLDRLRSQVKLVMYSLPGPADSIRTRLYRSFSHTPSPEERARGTEQLKQALQSFEYRGQTLPATLKLSTAFPVKDYFRQFPGLDASARYNNDGFWQLPIPVTSDLQVHPHDVVIYDAEGYAPLRRFLQEQGIRHVLLTGYATDMCYCRTTAGYENLSQDFNVFLVGDASLATFPANSTPRFAVNAAISFASLTQLITQVSWVRPLKQQE